MDKGGRVNADDDSAHLVVRRVFDMDLERSRSGFEGSFERPRLPWIFNCPNIIDSALVLLEPLDFRRCWCTPLALATTSLKFVGKWDIPPNGIM